MHSVYISLANLSFLQITSFWDARQFCAEQICVSNVNGKILSLNFLFNQYDLWYSFLVFIIPLFPASSQPPRCPVPAFYSTSLLKYSLNFRPIFNAKIRNFFLTKILALKELKNWLRYTRTVCRVK